MKISVENLEKMINWNLVDEKFNYAIVNEVAISFYVTKPLTGEPLKIIERPRVFEEQAFYIAKLPPCNYRNTVVQFCNERFYVPGAEMPLKSGGLAFIGEKLPDSLWGDQS